MSLSRILSSATAGFLALLFVTTTWYRTWDPRPIAPDPLWVSVLASAERCTGLELSYPFGDIRWLQVDSITDLEGRRYIGLHMRAAGVTRIWLVDPGETWVVCHELLHALRLDHEDELFLKCQ